MKRATLEAILRAQGERRAVSLITELSSGNQWLVPPTDPASGEHPMLDGLAPAIEAAQRSDRASTETTGTGRFFIQPFCPTPRIVIVGAVHIAQHLAVIAERIGHAVTIVDPRSAFATPARFPGVALRAEWPDEALGALGIDERSAIVTLSHDPKIDDPALAHALRSSAYYIGCLGSQRTQARRRERLMALGFSAADLERLHGPIGLDLGARSPAEIAVSIAAELTQQLRRPRP